MRIRELSLDGSSFSIEPVDSAGWKYFIQVTTDWNKKEKKITEKKHQRQRLNKVNIKQRIEKMVREWKELRA